MTFVQCKNIEPNQFRKTMTYKVFLWKSQMSNMNQLIVPSCKSSNIDQQLERQNIETRESSILKLDLIREINLTYDSHKYSDSYIVIHTFSPSLANAITRGRIIWVRPHSVQQKYKITWCFCPNLTRTSNKR